MTRFKRLFLVAAFLGLLYLGFELTGLRGHFNLVYIHQAFDHNRLLGLALFIALFVVGNLIQIPGWVFLASAVLALGQFWGGVATFLAAMVSCAATFLVIRLVGGSALREVKAKWAQGVMRQLDAHPVRSVVVLRLVMQTVPALNYALALSGIRFADYLLGTALGLPSPIALYCVFFDYAARLMHVPGY